MPSDITSLVKFCPVDTGVQILTGRSLRWSAAHLFGDPFELQHASDPGLTAPALLHVLLREALIILFGPNPPSGRHNRLINTLARWREEERFCDEQEAETVLRELLGQIAELHARQIDAHLAAWRQFARATRIACFCDRPDNPSAWQRFADNHRGLALRFDCGAETGLPDPKPVQYQNQTPQVMTLAGQIDVIFGRRQPPDAGEFTGKLLSKGSHNRAEAEWRCFFQESDELESDDQRWYSLRPFPARELRAVYLGAGMARADREQVARLLRADYPDARLHQAVPVAGRYELAFESVGRR